jgi:uncharacterized membrane protein
MQWLRRSFIAGFFVIVPLLISVYAFIKIFQIVDGLTTPLYDRLLGRRIPFSPDNEAGFKRVVMIEDPRRGYVLGFLTREFVVDRGRGSEALLAVYLPTNNLYLGDVVICDRDRAVFPDLTVEEGIRIFLTGGMALPPRLRL